MMVRRQRVDNKRLLFTSAGDRSNVSQWVSHNRSYDLAIVYYGDGICEYADDCEFYLERKGGKLQNFYFFYNKYRKEVGKYEQFFIADDDILISSRDIDKAFGVFSKYDVKLFQPAFNPAGKNSYSINIVKPFSDFRYVNYNESGVIFIDREALEEFMNHFDPRVNCVGVSWWLSNIVQKKFGDLSIGVVDAIVCTNPHDIDKGKNGEENREIDIYLSEHERIKKWKEVKKEKGLDFKEGVFYEYKKIYNFSPFKFIFWSWLNFLKYIQKIDRGVRRFRRSFTIKR